MIIQKCVADSSKWGISDKYKIETIFEEIYKGLVERE
jgi:hypothetical protein|tara:strand:+ start:241 stop:351 length:111 start_codon:yes stop_codon:yes gene_type:complete